MKAAGFRRSRRQIVSFGQVLSSHVLRAVLHLRLESGKH